MRTKREISGMRLEDRDDAAPAGCCGAGVGEPGVAMRKVVRPTVEEQRGRYRTGKACAGKATGSDDQSYGRFCTLPRDGTTHRNGCIGTTSFPKRTMYTAAVPRHTSYPIPPTPCS